MPHLHGRAIAFEFARDVEQTPEVARHKRIGTRSDDVCRFLADDLRRNIAVLHREGAPEAATRFAVRDVGEFDTVELRQKRAWLIAHIHFAQRRTRIVIGDSAVIAPVQPRHLKHVDQKPRQFPCSIGQRLRCGPEDRIVRKQRWIVLLDHSGA